MNYRLRRVEPWSAARTMVALYAFLGLLWFIVGVTTQKTDLDPAGVLTALMSLGLLLPGIGFLSTALGCMVFNLAAQWSHGIVIELEPPHGERQRSAQAAS